jgi:hypothetical protein
VDLEAFTSVIMGHRSKTLGMTQEYLERLLRPVPQQGAAFSPDDNRLSKGWS